jgi:hypothetical protein
MSKNKEIGDTGELEIVDMVPCPNCGKKLMKLPPNYPLYDVQCTGCLFRAQVKTNNIKPQNVIRGAGWEIMNKVFKAGFLTPPLIVNFKWQVKGKNKQEIRFYPFINKSSFIKTVANIKSRNRKHKMFNYNLKDLKFYLLPIKNNI